MRFNYSFTMICLFIYVAGWAVAGFSNWRRSGKVKALSIKSRSLTFIGGLGWAIIVMQGPYLALPLLELPPPLLMTAAGCLLVVVGISLALGGYFQYPKVFAVSMWRKGGELRPAIPYTLMRQPIYAGLILALLGFFCLLPMLNILILCFFLGVVLILKGQADDAFLKDRLGEDYEAYRSRVPIFFPSFRLKN